MSPFCIACEMILAMLSNLLWSRSLMALCFSCFKVKVLKVFRVVTVARERIRLVPLKAMPTSRPTPLENAAIKIPPVITVNVIRSVSTMPVIVLNHLFFFFGNPFTNFNFIKQICLNFSQLSKRYVYGSCGCRRVYIWINFACCFIVAYAHSLFNIWRYNVLGITSLLFSSSILKSS